MRTNMSYTIPYPFHYYPEHIHPDVFFHKQPTFCSSCFNRTKRLKLQKTLDITVRNDSTDQIKQENDSYDLFLVKT